MSISVPIPPDALHDNFDRLGKSERRIMILITPPPPPPPSHIRCFVVIDLSFPNLLVLRNFDFCLVWHCHE
jgi:hypothetical protein